MLAFNNIGSLGRLGNQMFEYATLRGIAAKHGYEWMIPPPENGGIENYSLHSCFKLSPDRKEGVLDNVTMFKNLTFIFVMRYLIDALIM